jgi:hypothetical protein
MKRFLLVGVVLLNIHAVAQSKYSSYAELTGAAATFQGTASISVQRLWHIKTSKLSVGAGIRFSSYFAANQYYVTAPATLTSGKTGPLVLFTENIPNNMDSFLVKAPQVNAINAMISLGYAFSKKVWVGFNIDAMGFSFGRITRGNYINGFEGANVEAKPTSFNVLLISDNDLGTLNSELYGRYLLSEKWSVKAGFQFLFTEYTTETKVQQLPESNNRFRRKSLLVAFGISRSL